MVASAGLQATHGRMCQFWPWAKETLSDCDPDFNRVMLGRREGVGEEQNKPRSRVGSTGAGPKQKPWRDLVRYLPPRY